jgi:dihydroxyacetone kinase DhaKLM complex PTS-EIIA-like component DhaM
LLFSATTFAHEGHTVPGVIAATYGGTAVGGKEINLEYVINGNELKLYPMSHEGKALTNQQVVLTVTAKAPKQKNEKLNVIFSEGAFTSKVEFKNSHRLEINVTTETNHKKDNFKFQMEQ